MSHKGITPSAGDAQMGASNEIICNNSDHHDIKKGVCRVSKFVNNSQPATGQFLLA